MMLDICGDLWLSGLSQDEDTVLYTHEIVVGKERTEISLNRFRSGMYTHPL